MSFLKLTNLQNGDEFIVKQCTQDNFKDEAKELYNELKNKYDKQVEEVGEGDSTRYSFIDDVCFIYALQPIIKQGYIWKSSSLKKIELFKINLVQEYPREIKKKEVEKEKFYQHGYGYSSNIITSQFPLTSFPIELSKELESKLRLVRESFLTEDEDESNTCSIENYSEFAETETESDTSEEVVIKKKMS